MRKHSKNKFQRSIPLGRMSFLASVFLLVIISLTLTSCNNKEHDHEHDVYTCPMHPTVISDRPGTCPVCGMDLVRKARPGEEVAITKELKELIKSPNEAIVSSVKTIKGEYKIITATIEAEGVVAYDTRNINTVSARIGGRLEKVLIKYPYQQITKGEKIAEIYSPELVAAQKELLFLIENDPENSMLIESAKQKLSLLGVTNSQIEKAISTREAQQTFAIYSPYSGYVITSDGPSAPVTPIPTNMSSSSGGMSDGMSAAPSTNPSASAAPATETETLIREGTYVNPGDRLFKIVNLSDLVVEVSVPMTKSSSIQKNATAELDFGNGKTQKAKIDFIQPFFTEGQEFLKARIYIPNRSDVQIGHLVNVKITAAPLEALWVPKEAVLNLGTDNIVFVKDESVFKPTKVTTGSRSEGLIEIKQGLSSADEIAGNAYYLVDSESFIKTQK